MAMDGRFWTFSGEKGDEDDFFKSCYDYGAHYQTDFGYDTKPILSANDARPSPEDEAERRRRGLSQLPSFHEFTQQTTMHGIAYVFEGRFRVRRILWLLVVGVCWAILVMQLGQRAADYFLYGTMVDVQLVYAASVAFPAVTLCNQNNYRTSKAVEYDLYYFLDEIYSVENSSSVNLSKYHLDGVDTKAFLEDSAHQLTDFIDSCSWKGEPCNLTRDFVVTNTDMGVCYTFNSGKNQPQYDATESGTQFGLSLILNAEQYEYMRGPHSDAGIKVLLHDPGEFPLVHDLGFAAAPGIHTLVALERTETNTMEPPYGKCDAADTTPMSTCLLTCRTRMLSDVCGCRDFYMPPNVTNEPIEVCDMESKFVCVREKMNDVMKRQSECNCLVPCSRASYKPKMSYALLSKFNIDRMVMNDPLRRAYVNDKFLLARELAQRVQLDVVAKDEAMLDVIQRDLDTLWQDLKVVVTALESDEAFAQAFGILPIVEVGDGLLNKDLQMIGARFANFGTLLKPVMTTEIISLDKWLPAAMFNLLEVSLTPGETPGIATKIGTCSFTYPLPDYGGDIRGYFAARKKRSHVPESPAAKVFFGVENAEYEKVKTVSDCNDYLSLKQDLAQVLANIRPALEADKQHIEQIYAAWDALFADAFRNTYRSPTDLPKYTQCIDVLDYLKDTLFVEIDTLVAQLTAFQAASNDGEVMAALSGMLGVLSTTGLVETAAYTAQGKLYLNCYWVYFDLMSENDEGRDYGLMKLTQLEFTNAYLAYPGIKTSFSNLHSYVKEMYDVMKDNILPAMDIINTYRSRNATKKELASVFDSISLQKAFVDLVSLGVEFISGSREFKQRLESVFHNIKTGHIYAFSFTLPVVDTTALWQLNFVKHAQSKSIPSINGILAQMSADPSKSLVLYQMFLATMEQSYTLAVDSLRHRLPLEIDKLLKAYHVMLEGLLVYADDSRMNEAFFMENIVQLDVYYKDLSFTKVTVTEELSFVSLLGEIGGFMGLLCGMSVLTICEIIDFIIFRSVKECGLQRLKKKMKKQKQQVLKT